MKISIIIPVHNNLKETKACIESLENEALYNIFEIVVVNNSSQEDTLSYLTEKASRHSNIKIINLECNVGFPKAVNVGVNASSGDFIFILNNDTIIPKNTLSKLLRVFERHNNVGVVVPSSDRVKGDQRINVPPINGDPKKAEEISLWLEKNYHGKIEDVGRAVGMAMLLKRDFWDKVGGFDERFGLGNFEDDDFCLRVRLLGNRIIIARDAFIHHAGRKTFDYLNVDYDGLVRKNFGIYVEKWKDHPSVKAELCYHKKEYENIIIVSRYAMENNVIDYEIYRYLGEALLNLGHFEPAIKAFDRTLKTAERYTTCCFLKLTAQLALNWEKDARETAALLLKEFYLDDHAAANVLNLIGEACIGWGAFKEAEEYFLLSLGFEDNNPEAICGIATIFIEEGKKVEAIKFLEKADNDPTALAMQAVLYWEMGEDGKALDLFVEALKKDPSHQASLKGIFTICGTKEMLAENLTKVGLEDAAELVRLGQIEMAKKLVLNK